MARFFVNRPIVAMVMSIVIMLLGLVALQKLPISQYPEITPPEILVEATYTGGYLLNLVGQIVYEKLGFWPPDADIPVTNIPFIIVVLTINIFGEELWWRGYILPRQELEHGKLAFLVNGILWSLFHMFKRWAVPLMIFRTWMEPFVVQRKEHYSSAIFMHFISNGT